MRRATACIVLGVVTFLPARLLTGPDRTDRPIGPTGSDRRAPDGRRAGILWYAQCTRRGDVLARLRSDGLSGRRPTELHPLLRAPQTFEAGYRLIKKTQTHYGVRLDGTSANLPGQLEIPMESFARAVEIVLKASESRMEATHRKSFLRITLYLQRSSGGDNLIRFRQAHESPR